MAGTLNAEQVYVAVKTKYPKTFDRYMTDMNAAVSDLREMVGEKKEDEPRGAAE